MKLAYARGYIVTANPDGSVPLNSKIVARADSHTSTADLAAQSLVDSYNQMVDERDELLSALVMLVNVRAADRHLALDAARSAIRKAEAK